MLRSGSAAVLRGTAAGSRARSSAVTVSAAAGNGTEGEGASFRPAGKYRWCLGDTAEGNVVPKHVGKHDLRGHTAVRSG